MDEIFEVVPFGRIKDLAAFGPTARSRDSNISGVSEITRSSSAGLSSRFPPSTGHGATIVFPGDCVKKSSPIQSFSGGPSGLSRTTAYLSQTSPPARVSFPASFKTSEPFRAAVSSVSKIVRGLWPPTQKGWTSS